MHYPFKSIGFILSIISMNLHDKFHNFHRLFDAENAKSSERGCETFLQLNYSFI